MMLQFSYIALSILMTTLLVFIGNYAINQTSSSPKIRIQNKIILIAGLLIWQIYIGVLGSSGFLTDFSFPPRFFLLLILPAFVFTGIFLFQNRKTHWVQSIPTSWLTIYQSFRIIIETLFVYTVSVGFLHKNVTIEGYNFDMLFAFTAPAIAFLVFHKKINDHLILAWNYLGLFVISIIIFLFISTIYFPQLYGPNPLPFPTEFATFPYALVPGFLMPSAVFIHVLSIVQLKNKNTN